MERIKKKKIDNEFSKIEINEFKKDEELIHEDTTSIKSTQKQIEEVCCGNWDSDGICKCKN